MTINREVTTTDDVVNGDVKFLVPETPSGASLSVSSEQDRGLVIACNSEHDALELTPTQACMIANYLLVAARRATN